jgi:hypothetical protein
VAAPGANPTPRPSEIPDWISFLTFLCERQRKLMIRHGVSGERVDCSGELWDGHFEIAILEQSFARVGGKRCCPQIRLFLAELHAAALASRSAPSSPLGQ